MLILGTPRARFNRRLLTAAILCLVVALALVASPLVGQGAALSDTLWASGPASPSNTVGDAPSSTVLVPADGQCYGELKEVSGEASGDATEVWVSIRNAETEKYWNGEQKWVDTEKWLPTVLKQPVESGKKGTWSRDKVPSWELGKRYTVRSKAQAGAKEETPGNGHVFLYGDCQYVVHLPLVLRGFPPPPPPPPTWHPGKGMPVNVTVYSVASCPKNPRVAYAATTSGVYRSGDGGRSWPEKWLTATTFYSVAVNPDDAGCKTVLAGTKGKGLLITTDVGTSWDEATGIPNNLDVFAVAVDPKNSKRVYAGAGGQGMVYQSSEPGQPWALFSDGLPPGSIVRTLTMDRSDLQTIYAGTWGRNVHKREYGGTEWSPWEPAKVPESPYIYALTIDPSDQKVVFAGTYQNGVHRTSDKGENWKRDGLGTKSVLAVLVNDDGSTYAGADGTADGKSVYMRNGSNSWEAMPEQPGAGQNLKVWSLVTSDSVLLAGTTDGVWWYGSR